MRHLAHHLALAAALVLVGTSAADAAPRKLSKAQRASKARAARAAAAKAEAKRARERLARAREEATDDDEDADRDDDDVPARSPHLAGKTKRKAARLTHARAQAEDEDAEDAEVASGDDAKPARGKRRHAPARRIDDDGDDDGDGDDDSDKRDDRVAFASRDPEGEAIGEEIGGEIEMPAADASADTSIRVRHRLGTPRAKKWSVSFGPYAWASAVDASVAVGAANVNAGADFSQMSQHAKFGAEALAELRYGRFSLSTDLMYGVLGLEGAKEVGPVMVTYDGTATSALVDALGGVTLYGDDHSLFSIEARGGLRYQRTVIQASVGVAGAGLDTPSSVDSGADALAGGRVFVRPTKRLFASASLDKRVFGASNDTWSATADAGLRVGHFQLSLGYRTVTEDRNNTNIRMYGPRLAIQLAF